MSKRKVAVEIAAKFPMTGSSVEWVEVEAAEELKNYLKSKGITKFARYIRNPLTYDGSVQGKFLGIDAIDEAISHG